MKKFLIKNYKNIGIEKEVSIDLPEIGKHLSLPLTFTISSLTNNIPCFILYFKPYISIFLL